MLYQSLIEAEFNRLVSGGRLTDPYAHLDYGSIQRLPDFSPEEFRRLLEEGYVLALDSGYRSLLFDLAVRLSDARIQYRGAKYVLDTIFDLSREPVVLPEDRNVSIGDFEFGGYNGVIADAFAQLGITHLDDFQSDTIQDWLKYQPKYSVLVAPTGTGKTAIFLAIALTKITHGISAGKRGGVQAIMAYPRKALGLDQLSKLLPILDVLNNRGYKVTLGIDDGDTPRSASRPLPFRGIKCLKCGSGELEIRRDSGVGCPECGGKYNYIYATREAVWEGKPLILITNLPALDFRLASPQTRSMFSQLELVICDEAHEYASFLGGNVRYTLRRLEASSEGEPHFILSSATIPSPRSFAQKLLGTSSTKVYDFGQHSIYQRVKDRKLVLNLIVVTNPVLSWETLLSEMAALLSTAFALRRGGNSAPQSLVFVDSIRSLHRLYRQTDQTVNLMEPNGLNHLTAVDANIPLAERYNWAVYNPFRVRNTSFHELKSQILEVSKELYSDHPQKTDIQRGLKERSVGCAFSTSALELGIDYPGVNVVCNVGTANPISAVQRKGRAGRDRTTHFSVLHVVLVRNNPVELHYASNPEALLDPFQGDLPVAFENPAVLQRNALMCCLDYLAQRGKNTYAMGDSLNSIPRAQQFLGDLSGLLDDRGFDEFLRRIFGGG